MKLAGHAADGDTDVDDRLAGPVEGGVEERAEPGGAARGAGERAVEQVEDAEGEDEDARQEPGLRGRRRPRRRTSRGSRSAVSAFGVRPRRPRPRAIGVARSRTRARMRRRDEGAGHEAVLLPVLDPEDAPLVLGEGAEGLRQEAGHGLAADSPRLDEPRDPEATEVPRHERLAQPDPFDELGHGRLALGEALHDPKAVHVGERLVDEAQRAEVLGLVDDGRDGRADVRGGRCQGSLRIPRPDRGLAVDGSTLVYINMH